MLDLLQVTVEAGAVAGGGAGRGRRAFHGPLAAEWRVGGRGRARSAAGRRAAALTARLPAERARGRSSRHARAPAGAACRSANCSTRRPRPRARTRSRQQMREQAARAGPKIQLVVALLLVPSVMLIVAAALIAELTAGLGSCPAEPSDRRQEMDRRHCRSLQGPRTGPETAYMPGNPRHRLAAGRRAWARWEYFNFVLQSGGEWGKVAAHVEPDGDGGVPPTPPSPARTSLQQGDGLGSWRFGGSTSTRWTRRTGSRFRRSSGEPLSDGVVLAK